MLKSKKKNESQKKAVKLNQAQQDD